MGSPFYVEIYDPNKIRVEGVKSGMIGETIGFDSKFLRSTLVLARLTISEVKTPHCEGIFYFDFSCTQRSWQSGTWSDHNQPIRPQCSVRDRSDTQG